MTDIKNHLASALGDEPPMVDDLDAVMSTGRRRLRRRTGWLAVAGTAGAAALATAVVVPILATQHGGSTPTRVTAATSPKAKPTKCKSFIYIAKQHGNLKSQDLKKAYRQLGAGPHHIVMLNKKQGKQLYAVTNCAHGLTNNDASAADSGPTGPKYHYTEAPSSIASRLATKLAGDIAAQNLTVVYSRPFAQESSTLESGHPTYFDGSVDVKVGSTLGDVTVQVNHPTTTQQPFTGSCDGTGFAQCQRTTLADGAVLQTNQVKVGHGTYIVEAQLSRPDGTLVQVQESNYGFGPEAGKSYGDQPLPLSVLVTMAEDSGYSF